MASIYAQYEYWFAATQLFLAMLGMGATLQVKDFKDVLIEPKAVLIGSGAQLCLVPIVAYLLITLGGLSGGIAIGIALIAAIPGGTVSNIFTHFAKGNSALSISVTLVTTLACLATTPLILSALITEYMPANFAMPAAKIASEIALFLLFPLILGMLYLRALPKSAEMFSNICIRGSLLVIILIVVGSASMGRLDLSQFGATNIGWILALMAALIIAVALVSRLLKLSTHDRAAIEIEIVVRNVNLGLLINASLFPTVSGVSDPTGNIVLLALLLFGAIQLLIGAGLIAYYRVLHK